MSITGIHPANPAAPGTAPAPPALPEALGRLLGPELACAVAAVRRSGGAPDAGQRPAPGTPVTAGATRSEFGAGDADGALPELEIPLLRAWRMTDVMAALGGGPRAERLIELANRPGPVQPGSLLEAIKRLRAAPPETSRAV